MREDFAGLEGSDKEMARLLDNKRTEKNKARQSSQTKLSPPKHAPGEKFVRGPIPNEWLLVALLIGDKAGHLSFALWWLAGIKHPFRLTSKVLRDFNIAPRTARRLLCEFERAGLIISDRKQGRGPDITLTLPPTNSTGASSTIA